MTEKNSEDNRGGEGGARRGRKRRRGRRGGGKGPNQPGPKQESSSRPPQAGGGDSDSKSRSKRRRRGRGKSSGADGGSEPEKKKPVSLKPYHHVVKKYGIEIYDTFAAAQSAIEDIRSKATTFDQLNVVIRAEGDMEDPLLNEVENVKVFAGTAWALIHDRRIEDGWYEEPR